MRRQLAVVAAIAVLAGCMKKETPAADSAATATPAPAAPALTTADLAGTWEATGMPMNKDTVVVKFTMTNTADSSHIVFASGEKVNAAAGTVSGDSIITPAITFKSQIRKGLTVTSNSVWRKNGDQLVGITHSKYSNGDTASFRITATKKP